VWVRDLATESIPALAALTDIREEGAARERWSGSGVDALVNNAGACIHGPALDMTPQAWREVMAVNLDALWAFAQTFGQRFAAQRGAP